MTTSTTGVRAVPDGASAPSGRVADRGADDLGTDEAAALADRVQAAVLAVPGVVEMHGGAFGEVATLLPGRRVRGVRLSGGDGTEVHVVASTSSPVTRTAEAVHVAVGAVVPGPVHVVVGDVLTPAEQLQREQDQAEQDQAEQDQRRERTSADEAARS